MVALGDATGPDLPFASWPSAAVQLRQTCHSFILQNFRRVKVLCADFPDFRCTREIGLA